MITNQESDETASIRNFFRDEEIEEVEVETPGKFSKSRGSTIFPARRFSFGLMHLGVCVVLGLILTTTAWAEGAVVESVEGRVMVLIDRSSQSAVKGMQLDEGSLIVTGATGRAVLIYDEHEVELGPRTSVRVGRVRDQSSGLSVARGTIRSLREGPPRERIYRVVTPVAVIGVRGTDFLVAAADDGSSRAGVRTGRVGAGMGDSVQVLDPGSEVIGSAESGYGRAEDRPGTLDEAEARRWRAEQEKNIEGRIGELTAMLARLADEDMAEARAMHSQIYDGAAEAQRVMQKRTDEMIRRTTELRQRGEYEEAQRVQDEWSRTMVAGSTGTGAAMRKHFADYLERAAARNFLRLDLLERGSVITADDAMHRRYLLIEGFNEWDRWHKLMDQSSADGREEFEARLDGAPPTTDPAQATEEARNLQAMAESAQAKLNAAFEGLDDQISPDSEKREEHERELESMRREFEAETRKRTIESIRERYVADGLAGEELERMMKLSIEAMGQGEARTTTPAETPDSEHAAESNPERRMEGLVGVWRDSWVEARQEKIWTINRDGLVYETNVIRNRAPDTHTYRLEFTDEPYRLKVHNSPTSSQRYAFYQPEDDLIYLSSNLIYDVTVVPDRNKFLLTHDRNKITYENDECQVVNQSDSPGAISCGFEKVEGEQFFRVRYSFPHLLNRKGEPREFNGTWLIRDDHFIDTRMRPYRRIRHVKE